MDRDDNRDDEKEEDKKMIKIMMKRLKMLIKFQKITAQKSRTFRGKEKSSKASETSFIEGVPSVDDIILEEDKEKLIEDVRKFIKAKYPN